jgi:peptidoglycan/LPS O-acetylase OafA/YrhL
VTATRKRSDVEGLRAVAVVGVVLYHVGLLQGGFVGVDAFFVVSGFLITALLWREVESTRRVAFGAFYGRRARRLLPASALVLAATVIASAAWLTPLDARSVMGDARASALYVANYRFIAQHTNYLAPHAASPLQHYWSLAVEEQFYLFWPLLLVALAWVCRRRVGFVCGVLAVLGAGSLFLSWRWTTTSPAWAIFSLSSRAWELIAGALIALGVAVFQRIPAPVARALTWLGLIAILWSMFTYSSTTPFPGTAALVPVLGTACVLMGGCVAHRGGAGVVLDRKPVQFVGGISYAWYLWHWPVIVLAPFAVGHALTTGQNLALAAGSGVLAFVTMLIVERPVRFSRRLAAPPRRSLALGAALTVSALVVTAFVAAGLPSLTGRGTAEVLQPVLAPVRPVAQRTKTKTKKPTTDAVSRALEQATGERVVPANLSPSLADAAHDEAAPFREGCDDSWSDTSVHPCVFGDPNGSKTIVLFGDSHAAMYEPPFDLVGKVHHWRVITLSKATCTLYIEHYFSPVLGHRFVECERWRDAAYAYIATVHPALVVVAAAHHYGHEYGFRLYSRAWDRGVTRVARRLRHLAPHVLMLGPTPIPGGDIPSCLSAHMMNAEKCALRRDLATNPLGIFAEAAAASDGGADYVDVLPWYCTPRWCPVIVGNLLVFRDNNHITTTYASWLAPRVEGILLREFRR